jgi:hypothetical protein
MMKYFHRDLKEIKGKAMQTSELTPRAKILSKNLELRNSNEVSMP